MRNFSHLIAALVLCLVIGTGHSVFGFLGPNTLVSVPSADTPEAGSIEYGFLWSAKNTTNNYTSETNVMLRFSPSDRIVLNMKLRDGRQLIGGVYAQLMQSENPEMGVINRLGLGYENIGWDIKKPSSESVNDLVLNYTLSIPEVKSNYHVGVGRSIYDDTDYRFFAGFDQTLRFGKVLAEYDGKSVAFGMKFPNDKTIQWYLFIVPEGFSKKSVDRHAISLGFMINDNVFEEMREALFPEEYLDEEIVEEEVVEEPMVEEPVEPTPEPEETVAEEEPVIEEPVEEPVVEEPIQEEEPEVEEEEPRLPKAPPEDDFALSKAALVHMEKGLQAYYQKDFDTALNEYQMVVDLTPQSEVGYVRLGSIYYQLGLYDDAKETWQKALDINPENEDVQTFLSDLELVSDDEAVEIEEAL